LGRQAYWQKLQIPNTEGQGSFKLQTLNTKHQKNTKLQAPGHARWLLDVRGLELIWSLVFGVWCFLRRSFVRASFWSRLVAAGICCLSLVVQAEDRCAICGNEISGAVILMTDAVTKEKKEVCESCERLKERCFLCELPVKQDYTTLPDGRYICARDGKTAVITDDDAGRIFSEVRDALDRQFSRFLSFPETNLTTAMMDRVNLMAMFGESYPCPVTQGYIQSKPVGSNFHHEISILSGLPAAHFKAVCVHEITHAWVFENVPLARRMALRGDAHEGFCELLAYLFMDAQHEEDEKKTITENAYTRGQIALFIAAESRYGFNDIVDWMKSGADNLLRSDDLGRIRTLQAQTASAAKTSVPLSYKPAPPAVFNDLTLKSIIWSPGMSLAIINGRTFGVQEQGSIPLGSSNVTIRCLAIQKGSVRVRLLSSGQERDLVLSEP
jgi:hypothetical protein